MQGSLSGLRLIKFTRAVVSMAATGLDLLEQGSPESVKDGSGKRPIRPLRRCAIAFGGDNLPVPIHGRHRGDHPAGTGPAACAKTAQASAPPTPVLTLTITRARRVAGNRRLMSVLATTRGAGITDRMSPTPG